LSLFDALYSLNQSQSIDSFIAALNTSIELQELLATPGLKTALAPSDLAVLQVGGIANLTDDVLKNHIFPGNLTASVLLQLSEITSLGGTTFAVSQQVSTRRGRRTVIITIGNDRGRAVLTALDIPSSDGVVHGSDRVLVAEDSEGGSSSTNADNDRGLFDGHIGDWVFEWVLIAIAVLIVVLVLLSAAMLQRSSSASTQPSNDELGGSLHRIYRGDDVDAHDEDGNNFTTRTRALNADHRQASDDFNVSFEIGASERQEAIHFYPDGGGTANEGGVGAAGGAQRPTNHFYPAQTMAQFEATVPAEVRRQPSGKSRGKLATPQLPTHSTHGPLTRRPMYMDPTPQ